MADFGFVVSKGQVEAYYERVRNNDPATARLVIVPLEASGLEAQGALEDSLTLAEVLDGATNEQTTMGRKYWTDTDLAALEKDYGNNWVDANAPDVQWAAATGNPLGAVVICYDPSAGADSTIIPLTHHTFALTPDGSDVNCILNAEGFHRAT